MKTILVDAVHCFIIERKGKFVVFADMYKLLEEYLNRKIVLTGANDEEIKKFELDNIPYQYFTLKHNPEKTNPEYYKTLLANLNLKENGVIYFEHNINAVKSAQSIGMNTYHYDNDKKDLESLKNFLDDNL
ncbi:MAG: hypothetical protein WC908_00245 [Candidatus Paceibacterota bacterium]